MSIAAAVQATQTTKTGSEREVEVEKRRVASDVSPLDSIELPTLADPRPARTPGYMYEGYFYTS